MENEKLVYLLSGLLVGGFLGAMITAYLYFPDCWKTSSCVDDWWKESEHIGAKQGYCEYQEDFYLRFANEFEWDNTPEFCLALREYLIECSSSEHIEVRMVYDDRCLL